MNIKEGKRRKKKGNDNHFNTTIKMHTQTRQHCNSNSNSKSDNYGDYTKYPLYGGYGGYGDGSNILLISGSNISHNDEYGFPFDLNFDTLKGGNGKENGEENGKENGEGEKYLKQIAWGFWYRINDVIMAFLEDNELTFDSFSKIYKDGDNGSTRVTTPNKGEIFHYLLFSTDSEIKTKRSIKLCFKDCNRGCKDHVIDINDDNLEDPTEFPFECGIYIDKHLKHSAKKRLRAIRKCVREEILDILQYDIKATDYHTHCKSNLDPNDLLPHDSYIDIEKCQEWYLDLTHERYLFSTFNVIGLSWIKEKYPGKSITGISFHNSEIAYPYSKGYFGYSFITSVLVNLLCRFNSYPDFEGTFCGIVLKSLKDTKFKLEFLNHHRYGRLYEQMSTPKDGEHYEVCHGVDLLTRVSKSTRNMEGVIQRLSSNVDLMSTNLQVLHSKVLCLEKSSSLNHDKIEKGEKDDGEDYGEDDGEDDGDMIKRDIQHLGNLFQNLSETVDEHTRNINFHKYAIEFLSGEISDINGQLV